MPIDNGAVGFLKTRSPSGITGGSPFPEAVRAQSWRSLINSELKIGLWRNCGGTAQIMAELGQVSRSGWMIRRRSGWASFSAGRQAMACRHRTWRIFFVASALQAERIADDLGVLPVWDLSDLYAGWMRRRSARPRARSRAERGVRGALQGQSRDDRGSGRRRRAARRGDRRIRADRGGPRPARQLCRARLCRRHLRPGAREVLRRPAGAADHDLDAPPVLRAGAQPPRRRAARKGAGDAGARRTTGRGSRIFAWSGPTSSTIESRSSSTRNRSPAAARGTGSSTRRSPHSASMSRARSCRSSRR